MGGRRILSEQQLAEMAELRERGWGLSRIAEHFSVAGTPVSRSTVNWQCLRLGADAPPRLRGRQTAPREAYWRDGKICRPWTDADDRQLRELENTGISIMEITRRLGRSNSSVRGRLLTLSRHDARREEAQG